MIKLIDFNCISLFAGWNEREKDKRDEKERKDIWIMLLRKRLENRLQM